MNFVDVLCRGKSTTTVYLAPKSRLKSIHCGLQLLGVSSNIVGGWLFAGRGSAAQVANSRASSRNQVLRDLYFYGCKLLLITNEKKLLFFELYILVIYT